LKRQVMRLKGGVSENKEEEFFRMCLLSFQIKHKDNLKILKLDYKSLYSQVILKKLPFFMWNEWLRVCIERLQFEFIYKKTSEFEYAKVLSKKFELNELYF
jgi:hypothetical protein